MPLDENNEADRPEEHPGPANDDVELENGYETEAAGEPETVAEDDPSFLEPTARALEGEADELAAVEGESPQRDQTATEAIDDEVTSDAEGIADEPADETAAARMDWAREISAHRVAVELKRIESEVRAILGDKDHKRKRRLAGTRRWQELEDDVLAWRNAGRFDEDALNHLQQLITRRHYLFRHLMFVTSTRPTWNT